MQRAAELVHPERAELSDSAAEALLQHGDCIVQIDGARSFHAIPFVENYFRGHSADGRRDWGNGGSGEMRQDAVAS
jgi:hypothetical protein